MPTVLVIDDDRAIFLLIEQALQGVADVVTATTAKEGLERLQQETFDAVLLDIVLPDQNGMAVFCEIQEWDRRLPVILMTVDASSQTAIEAMQRGAFDYLAKPLDVTVLRSLVTKAVEQRAFASVPVAIVAEEAGDSGGEEGEQASGAPFIGSSPAMLEVFKAIGRVSKQDIPVLVRGESGTGKELVARALFQYSHRNSGPFLAVNCAALPETLLESELFGHEKGAFTGADSRRIGKFEQCNGGTLFLDEIGDMSPIVQAKVLRVLQDQRFERVGGGKELTTDVRIVAATNRPLEEMVEEGDFREDLLYRLNGISIQLPPLRNRGEDLPRLIGHFLGEAKREFGKDDLEGISPETLHALQQYDWPGNVRQLRAVIRSCVLDSVLPVIGPDDLPDEVVGGDGSDRPGGSSDTTTKDAPTSDVSDEPDGRGLPDLVDRLLAEESTDLYSQTIEYVERYLLLRVLRETDGNQSRAAEILGITRGKLRDRIQTFGIQLESGVKLSE